MMNDVTDRQRETYQAILDFTDHNGYCPSVRDIAASIGINVRGAYQHLLALRKKGFITWAEHAGRTIRTIKRLPK